MVTMVPLKSNDDVTVSSTNESQRHQWRSMAHFAPMTTIGIRWLQWRFIGEWRSSYDNGANGDKGNLFWTMDIYWRFNGNNVTDGAIGAIGEMVIMAIL